MSRVHPTSTSPPEVLGSGAAYRIDISAASPIPTEAEKTTNVSPRDVPPSHHNSSGNHSQNTTNQAASNALRTSTVSKDNFASDGKRSCGQTLMRGILSLRFVLLTLLVISLVSVSVISWQLTLRGANDSLNLVTNDYSNSLVTQISNEFHRRLTSAEHVTAGVRDLFRSGTLKYMSGGDNSAMLRYFRSQLTELVSDTVSTVSMTSKLGELNGHAWIFPDNAAPYEVRWDQTGNTLIETVLDANGNDAFVDLTDPNANSLTSAWVQASDLNDQTAGGWTSLYLFYGNYFVSQSFTIYDPTPSLVGVVTIDMQLGFIDSVAQQIAGASAVGTQVVILDVASGTVIGTSLTGFPLTDNSDPANVKGVYLFSPTSPSFLQSLHAFIMRETGRSAAVESGLLTNGDMYANLPGQISGARHIDGKDMLITVKPFTQVVQIDRGSNKLRPAANLEASQTWADSHGINWVLIVTIDRSTISHEISASNTKVLTSIICICIGFILAMSLLLWYSMRLINSLSFLLSSFARFEFRSHVESGQLKHQSVLTELRDLQVSAMEMTRAFKQHLDGKNGLFKNRHDQTLVSQPAVTTYTTPHQRDRSLVHAQAGDKDLLAPTAANSQLPPSAGTSPALAPSIANSQGNPVLSELPSAVPLGSANVE